MNYSNDEVVAAVEGDSHDGIYVYKNNRKIGFITDLRVKLNRESSKKAKQKVNSKRLAAELQQEAINLKDELYDYLKDDDKVEVFINITQPNIKVGEETTIYCMAGLNDKHRISITTNLMDFDNMSIIFSGYSLSQPTSNSSIVINNVNIQEILEIVNLCKGL